MIVIPKLRPVWPPLAVAALIAAGCRTVPDPVPPSRLLSRFQFEQPEMGVPFRMILYASDLVSAENAARAAFSRVRELNNVLSDYEFDSELSRLSRSSGAGRWVPVSPDLWTVLERAQRLARQTDGAFDVTVGPCANLWRRARRERNLPDPALINEIRGRVGYRWLLLDPRRRAAKLLRADMRLDLGGIAKGYALDQALDVLRRHSLERAMVSAGGDIVAGAAPPGTAGWRIALEPLDAPRAPPVRYLLLHDAALATSGDLFQRLEINGVRYSHILDPRTCIGLTDHSLVTLIAPTGITADSLATAISVLGPEEGFRLLKRWPRTGARIVRRPNAHVELYESPQFHRFLESRKDP